MREDYLGATYGWNALERVDPNFTGGAHSWPGVGWLLFPSHLVVAHHLPPPRHGRAQARRARGGG